MFIILCCSVFTNRCHSKEEDSRFYLIIKKDEFYTKFTSFHPQDTSQAIRPGEEKSTNLRMEHKCINISFSFRAFGIPWWYIVSIHNITVFSRWWLICEFRGRGDFDCLCRVMKCCHRKPCSIWISNCPMHTAAVLSIGYNLVPKEFSVKWKACQKQKTNWGWIKPNFYLT